MAKSGQRAAEKAARPGRVARRLVICAALSAPFVSQALAQGDRPIRVIVPGTPGGVADVAARTIGDAMQRELGQPWLVDPKPGASGIIGAKAFLDAPADGHTLYLTALSHVLLPFLTKVPFDVLADFRPVAMVGTSTFLLCVPAASPANTVMGFVDLARANPGKLNYLNPGIGTAPHLLPEMIKIRYGLDIKSIYYKGYPTGIADLASGNLDLGLVSTGLALSHVQQGRLKAIAQVSRRRIDVLENIPTLAEQGLGDLNIEAFLPLYGQVSMPAPAVARINRAVAAALADQPTRQRLAALHIDPLPMKAPEVEATMRREHDRLGAIIQQLGIRADDST
jgi:tripartite-type tricarboxylate transporter receptor subunit TctC